MTKKQILELAEDARRFTREGIRLAPPGLKSHFIAVDRRLRMMLGEKE